MASKKDNTLDTNQELVVSGTEIVSQVIQMGNGFEIAIPDDLEEVKRRLISAEVTHVLKAVEAGVYYKHLKEKLPHGEFQHFLKSIDASPQRAREQIAVSELFIKLQSKRRAPGVLENGDERTRGRTSAPTENSNARATAHLENQLKLSQLIELTKLPEEKIAQLDDEELEEFSKLPYRKLRGVVKQICLEFDEESKLEAENYNLKRQLQEVQQREAEAINAYHKEKLQKAPEKVFGLPPLVANVKQQAPALTQQIQEAGLDLVNLAERISQPGLDPEQAAMAAQALMAWLQAPMMQLHRIFDLLERRLGSGIFEDKYILPTYKEAEWEDANELRNHIIRTHEARFHPNLNAKQIKKRRRV